MSTDGLPDRTAGGRPRRTRAGQQSTTIPTPPGGGRTAASDPLVRVASVGQMTVADVGAWALRTADLLAAARERLDAANLFPVPDHDTGTNLALTVRAAADALVDPTRDAPPDVETALRRLATGAVRSARGNSGVIVSQVLRGVADAASGDTLDLSAALSAADAAAWAAVVDPVEGTMLTVPGPRPRPRSRPAPTPGPPPAPPPGRAGRAAGPGPPRRARHRPGRRRRGPGAGVRGPGRGARGRPAVGRGGPERGRRRPGSRARRISGTPTRRPRRPAGRPGLRGPVPARPPARGRHPRGRGPAGRLPAPARRLPRAGRRRRGPVGGPRPRRRRRGGDRGRRRRRGPGRLDVPGAGHPVRRRRVRPRRPGGGRVRPPSVARPARRRPGAPRWSSPPPTTSPRRGRCSRASPSPSSTPATRSRPASSSSSRSARPPRPRPCGTPTGRRASASSRPAPSVQASPPSRSTTPPAAASTTPWRHGRGPRRTAATRRSASPRPSGLTIVGVARAGDVLGLLGRRSPSSAGRRTTSARRLLDRLLAAGGELVTVLHRSDSAALAAGLADARPGPRRPPRRRTRDVGPELASPVLVGVE